MSNNINFNGQALQDKFVLEVLQYKKNGYFIEIGSHDYIKINNTYLLETKFNWNGIMIEIDNKFLENYELYRKNSVHIIEDATKINYNDLFLKNNVPKNIDYLQIDLYQKTSLDALIKLDNEIMNKYKFATITFEHDFYRDKNYERMNKQREILLKHGYYCVFENISNKNNPYEDWWVHPDLVDMNLIYALQNNNKNKIFIHSNLNCLNWSDIIY